MLFLVPTCVFLVISLGADGDMAYADLVTVYPPGYATYGLDPETAPSAAPMAPRVGTA